MRELIDQPCTISLWLHQSDWTYWYSTTNRISMIDLREHKHLLKTQSMFVLDFSSWALHSFIIHYHLERSGNKHEINRHSQVPETDPNDYVEEEESGDTKQAPQQVQPIKGNAIHWSAPSSLPLDPPVPLLIKDSRSIYLCAIPHSTRLWSIPFHSPDSLESSPHSPRTQVISIISNLLLLFCQS